MYPNKTPGIWETVMSALSFVIVRSRPAASRPRRRVLRPDPGATRSVLTAVRQKEIYFQMARQFRWNR